MHHAEIPFEQPEYEFLLAEARRLGTDVTALVRSYVAEHMPPPPAEYSEEEFDKALESIIGIGSDPEFSGEDHDTVLYGPLTAR